jgi:hypothetical protein
MFLDKNMMYDYLGIEKYFHGKDTPSFDNLKWIGRDLETHTFKISNGFFPLKVYWNEITERLQIKGSIPYFMQGHNFDFSNTLFYESVEILEQSLKINLLDAEVKTFEYGNILKVEQQPNHIFDKHLTLHGFERKPYSRGLYFEDKNLKVKLYDVGFRMKTACKRSLGVLRQNFGFDDKGNYLKIENHYKRPDLHFKQRNIRLENLFDTRFEKIIQEDLLKTYKQIETMKPLALPTDKKLINSSTVPILTLNELGVKYGFNPQQEIMNFLGSIPSNVLPKNDKTKRRTQLRQNFEKLQDCESTLIEWDLSKELAKSLLLM